MIKVNYIITAESERSGRSIYEREIRKRLKNLELNIIEYIPARAKTAKVINKLLKFPYRVKKRIKKGKYYPYNFRRPCLSVKSY